jgi:hypothetical protein
LPELLTAAKFETTIHKQGSRKMKIVHVMASLLLISSLATPTTAQERAKRSSERAIAHGIEGREIAAPPWSAACMTDHGPSECGEPMWIYGDSYTDPRYRNAF